MINSMKYIVKKCIDKQYTNKKYVNKKHTNKKYMDILLIIGLIIVSLAAALIVYLTHSMGDTVVIKVDGATVKEVSLSQDAEYVIEGYQGGSNRVIIKDGTACVSEADCPDELCVKSGKISRSGETVVCLPHRVVVEIKGTAKSDDDIDSVVR